MRRENTLMIYAKEVEERTFWDWLKAYTSFMKPLHNYEGVLKLNEDKLIFQSETEEKFDVKLKDIVDVSLGFDEIFTVWKERAVPWNKPLKINCSKEEQGYTKYLIDEKSK